MTILRRSNSEPVVWGMIALVLWSVLPASGCVCADGTTKLFCDRPTGGRAANDAPTVDDRDCCAARTAAATRGCCGAAGQSADGFHRGCKRVDRQPTLATIAGTAAQSLDELSVIATLPIDPPLESLTTVLATSEHAGAGPPVDLVIQFHCFLI